MKTMLRLAVIFFLGLILFMIGEYAVRVSNDTAVIFTVWIGFAFLAGLALTLILVTGELMEADLLGRLLVFEVVVISIAFFPIALLIAVIFGSLGEALFGGSISAVVLFLIVD